MCCIVSVLRTKDSQKFVRIFVDIPEMNVLQSISTTTRTSGGEIEMVMLVTVAVLVIVVEMQLMVCRYNIWYPWYQNGNKEDQNEAFHG